MKRLTLLLGSCLTALTMFNSCSNDFDLVDTWKDIPVVYGLLNVNDSIQYIKIEKAFLDANTSALVTAQEADSLYYSQISVDLEELDNSGAVEFKFPLTLVDANNEGFPKEEGVFATTPNYVFKTVEVLNPQRRYNIVINTGGDASQTITLQEKNGQRSIGLIGDFAITKPSQSTFFIFEPGRNSEFRWRSMDASGEENAAFYDVVMTINYTETQVGNPGSATNKSLEWVLRKNMPALEGNNTQEIAVGGTAFYQFLSQELEPVDLLCRQLNSFDLTIYAGGEDLYEYINRQTANTGITGNQPLTDYTNLSDGIGILSTRYNKQAYDFQFNAFVYEELLLNDLTKDLGFLEDGDNCN